MSERTEGMKNESKTRGQDILGLVLSGIGGLFAVSIVLSLGDRQPKEMVWTTPVVGLIDAIGAWPALLLSASTAVIGALSFLRTQELQVGRHLLGATGVAAGLALGFGSFSVTAGGALGSALPSVIAGTTGQIAAAVIGAGVILTSAWAAWLAGGFQASERPSGVRTLAPQKPEKPRKVIRDGVSPAEAAALIPDPVPSVPKDVRGPSLEDDVRHGGGVPAGTQPLSGSIPAPVRPITADEEDAEQANWDKVFEESKTADTVSVVGSTQGPQEGVTSPPTRRTPSISAMTGPTTAPPPPPVLPEDVVESEPTLEAEPEVASEPVLDRPPVASWETSVEDEVVPEPSDEWLEAAAPTVEPEEPIAELTPQQIQPEPEVAIETEAELETELAAPADLGPEAPEEAAPSKDQSASWEQVGLFDEQNAPEDKDTAEDEEEEYEEEPTAEDDSAEDEEGEYDEEDEEGDELAAEFDEDEDEDEEYEDDDEEEEEEDDGDELAAEYEEEEEEDGEYEDDEGEEEGDSDEVAAEEEEEAEEEPVTELVPAAAASPDSTPETEDAGAVASEQRLYEAGCLVLAENRVAVSMLQRRFEIDFDEACRLLDALQDRGLIGPYVGGRTRKILLSSEEWLAPAT